MKSLFYTTGCLALVLAFAPDTNAAVTVFADNAATDIPDGSSSGLARLIAVGGSLQTVVSLDVSLEIAASPGQEAFLGDLYVYLTHGSDIVVLLNRAGRTATAPAGYGDNQTLNVTFTEGATNDIHSYRVAVTGSAGVPLSGPLTGTWLPDGRATDPANVLDTDSPGSRLDVFDGAAAEGDWTLYVADLSGSAPHRLVSWSMTMTTVPEPSTLLLGLCALPLLLLRRR